MDATGEPQATRGRLDPVAHVRNLAESRSRAVDGVFVIAIDGRGGSGKTTLASGLAGDVRAAVVRTDDFFRQPQSHGVPQMQEYYDWQRLRAEALLPLRGGRDASFRHYDWGRGRTDAATRKVAASRVVLLEGVFSSAPQLADLVDYTVLVATPDDERLRRVRARTAPEAWDATWLLAEDRYFSDVRPAVAFDLVVPGAPTADSAETPIDRADDPARPR